MTGKILTYVERCLAPTLKPNDIVMIDGSAKAKPSGRSTSPLKSTRNWLPANVAEQLDLTLDEIVAAMRKRRVSGSRTAVWGCFCAICATRI